MFKDYLIKLKHKIVSYFTDDILPINQPNLQLNIEIKEDTKENTKEDTDNNENRNQLISTIFTTIIEGTKIVMATLLSVFVPQYCSDTNTTCTFSQNFSDLSRFNEFVLFVNFLTLALFIKLILVQNKREAYLISHLDESKDYPANSLEENIKSYPRILSRVKTHNRKLKKYTNCIIVLFTFNVFFSSILIFYFFYDGFRSVSTLLSNVLLVSSKLYNLYKISKECNQFKTIAMSSIHQTTISYNIPDKQYDIYSLFHTKMKSFHALNRYNRFSNKKRPMIIQMNKKYKSKVKQNKNI